MTETASQPDVTRLQPETGFSSRDRVRIHRAQEIRTCSRGGLNASRKNGFSVTVSARALISRCGDEMMRVMLYEAAQSMLRSKNLAACPRRRGDRVAV
jgi:hypothetical protein